MHQKWLIYTLLEPDEGGKEGEDILYDSEGLVLCKLLERNLKTSIYAT
jgi:hypothetical protein